MSLTKGEYKVYLEKWEPKVAARKILRTLLGYDHLNTAHLDDDIERMTNAIRAMLELGYERKTKPLDRKRITRS